MVSRTRSMITEYALSSIGAQSGLKVETRPAAARNVPPEELPEIVGEWATERLEADDDIEMPEVAVRPVGEATEVVMPVRGELWSDSAATSAEQAAAVPGVVKTQVANEEPYPDEVAREPQVAGVPVRPATVMREQTTEPVADLEATRLHRVRRDGDDHAEGMVPEYLARSRTVREPEPEPAGPVRVEAEAGAVAPVERRNEPETEPLSPIASRRMAGAGWGELPEMADTAVSGVAGQMSGQERRKLQEIEAAVQRQRQRDLAVEAGR